MKASFTAIHPNPEKADADADADAESQEEREGDNWKGGSKAFGKDKVQLLLGVSALVISSLSNSSQSVAVKMAGRAGCQPLVAATARFLIQITVSSWSLGGVVSPAREIWHTGRSRRFWIVVRCVSGCLNFGIFTVVVMSMAVGEATMIKYTSPVITCVLARFMLDEAWGWPESAALLVCMSGVVIVANARASASPAEHQAGGLGYHSAVALGLCGSACNAVRNISLKKLAKATEASGVQNASTTALQADLMTWLTGVAGLLMCGASALVLEGPRAFASLASPVCLLWVVVVGAAGYCTQWSFNWGAQCGTAILNSLLQYLDVVFSLTWQVIVFREPLTISVIVGAALAFFSVVLLTMEKIYRS